MLDVHTRVYINSLTRMNRLWYISRYTMGVFHRKIENVLFLLFANVMVKLWKAIDVYKRRGYQRRITQREIL